MKFSVPDMSCGHCKAAIEKAVLGAEPNAALSFDMEARNVEIQSAMSSTDIQAVLGKAGYPAEAL